MEKLSTRHRGEKPKMEIRLLTAIKVTQVQSTHRDYAYSVSHGPYGCWSAFIGTFRRLDFGRGASRNRTSRTLAPRNAKNCVSLDRATIVRQESTSKSVSLVLLTPKVYPQSLITFLFLLVLSRNRAA